MDLVYNFIETQKCMGLKNGEIISLQKHVIELAQKNLSTVTKSVETLSHQNTKIDALRDSIEKLSPKFDFLSSNPHPPEFSRGLKR